MKLLKARTAGFTLVVLLGGVILFQILMLVGYPLQRAMGGGPWDAPAPAMVIASFVASLILLFAMGWFWRNWGSSGSYKDAGWSTVFSGSWRPIFC